MLRRTILWRWAGVFLSLTACARRPASPGAPPSGGPPPDGGARVNAGYHRSQVREYDVYDWSIPGHRMVVVGLKDGAVFPLLCKETGTGLYPLPQSVFAGSAGSGAYRIGCEPFVRRADGSQGYQLMDIQLTVDSAGVREGATGAPREAVLPKPELIESPFI